MSVTLMAPAYYRRAARSAQRARRQGRSPASANHARRAWNEIVLKPRRPTAANQGGSVPVYAWVLAAAAFLLHVALLLYVTHGSAIPAAVVPAAELHLDILPPPPPKIEPPKPTPARVQPQQRVAPSVPPIQQATPVASDATAIPSEEPPVAAVAVAAPVEPTPPPVTLPFGRAGYLHNPAPEYPIEASRLNWQGTVLLRVHVLATGKPDVVQVHQSSGHRPLDDAAVHAVSRWTFLPAKRGDEPIDGWAAVPIEFQL